MLKESFNPDRSSMLALLDRSMQSLRRSGIIETDVVIEADTVLLGEGSSLDSMGFVTFITDAEERLNRETGKDVYVVLTDLEEIYPNVATLTGAMFADYLVSLVVA